MILRRPEVPPTEDVVGTILGGCRSSLPMLLPSSCCAFLATHEDAKRHDEDHADERTSEPDSCSRSSRKWFAIEYSLGDRRFSRTKDIESVHREGFQASHAVELNDEAICGAREDG